MDAAKVKQNTSIILFVKPRYIIILWKLFFLFFIKDIIKHICY